MEMISGVRGTSRYQQFEQRLSVEEIILENRFYFEFRKYEVVGRIRRRDLCGWTDMVGKK